MQFCPACIFFVIAANISEATSVQSALADYIKDPSQEAFDEEIICNVTAGTINNTDLAAENACIKAQEDWAATENALEKLAMRHYCEKACDEVDFEACGFLVNGLSLLTFLAVLEC